MIKSRQNVQFGGISHLCQIVHNSQVWVKLSKFCSSLLNKWDGLKSDYGSLINISIEISKSQTDDHAGDCPVDEWFQDSMVLTRR